jgi:hypothetical protein
MNRLAVAVLAALSRSLPTIGRPFATSSNWVLTELRRLILLRREAKYLRAIGKTAFGRSFCLVSAIYRDAIQSGNTRRIFRYATSKTRRSDCDRDDAGAH